MTHSPPTSATGRPVMSVSQLTLRIKAAIDERFSSVWVSGEVSNCRRQRSGHIYLALKDEAAVLPAVLWKSTAQRMRFELEDGQEVICHGGIDVYPPHGKYQLVIRKVEPVGQGALQLAFRQLHDRLQAEGLFEAEHKQPLPAFPRRIAFVTSPTGAAIRDFLNIARRRWRGVEILVIPARVQGDLAAGEVAAGIATANRLPQRPDVIVVGRGGGSLEDLWCFNEELVVRAIHASDIPVISAVGHEIDLTLSDLAADVRAPTPSAAAELAVPDEQEIRRRLRHHEARMRNLLHHRVVQMRQRVDAIAAHRVLRRPLGWLRELSQQLDDLEQRSVTAIDRQLAASRQQLLAAATQLESLSPLAVLRRGYSLTQRADNGLALREAGDVAVGDEIKTRLFRGELVSRVEEVNPDTDSTTEDRVGHRGK